MKKGEVVKLKKIKKTVAEESSGPDGIWDRPPSSTFYFAVGAFLWLLLTLLLSPPFERVPPTYQEGSISSKNIRAPYDFLVEDVISTQKIREEAEKNSPHIYDFDPSPLIGLRDRVEKAFDYVTEYYRENVPELTRFIEEKEERTEIDSEPDPSEKELLAKLRAFEYSPAFGEMEKKFQELLRISLSPRMLKTLRWHHYRSSIKRDILSLLSLTMNKGIVADKEGLSPNQGIVKKVIGTEKEKPPSTVDRILTPEEAHNLLRQLANGRIPAEHKALAWVIRTITQKMVTINLTFNKGATEKRKMERVNSQKPVFFQIQEGEMIVREGAPLTKEHLLKLEVLASQDSGGNLLMTVAGIAIFVFLFLLLLFIYIVRFHPELSDDRQGLTLIALILLCNISLAQLTTFLIQNSSAINLLKGEYYFAIPFAVGPMLISILSTAELTVIFSVVNALLLGLTVENGLALSIVSLTGGLITATRVNKYKRRSAILMAGFLVSLANVVVILPLTLMKNSLFTESALMELGCGLLSGILAAIIVSAFLPLIEAVFHYSSDIKLLELSDMNHPLLSEMVVKAPGTYNHSSIVGNLAEEAAKSIGANSLLAKVASYYHDIGKMKKPEYFVENLPQGAPNPHENLSPHMSALIIASHVKDGLEMARQHRLIPRISDNIPQHQGTGLIKFFYNKAKEQEKETNNLVKEEDFRYPGPKPRTKEAAIIHLADSVEAVSRLLDKPSHSRLNAMVREIIDDKFMDGQLDNSHLTFNDLRLITESFVRVLQGIFHSRIRYPEQEKNKKEDGDSDSRPTRRDKDRPGSSQNPGSKDIRIVKP